MRPRVSQASPATVKRLEEALAAGKATANWRTTRGINDTIPTIDVVLDAGRSFGGPIYTAHIPQTDLTSRGELKPTVSSFTVSRRPLRPGTHAAFAELPLTSARAAKVPGEIPAWQLEAIRQDFVVRERAGQIEWTMEQPDLGAHPLSQEIRGGDGSSAWRYTVFVPRDASVYYVELSMKIHSDAPNPSGCMPPPVQYSQALPIPPAPVHKP
jgi:hypothetical protein